MENMSGEGILKEFILKIPYLILSPLTICLNIPLLPLLSSRQYVQHLGMFAYLFNSASYITDGTVICVNSLNDSKHVLFRKSRRLYFYLIFSKASALKSLIWKPGARQQLKTQYSSVSWASTSLVNQVLGGTAYETTWPLARSGPRTTFWRLLRSPPALGGRR